MQEANEAQDQAARNYLDTLAVWERALVMGIRDLQMAMNQLMDTVDAIFAKLESINPTTNKEEA